MYGVIGNVSDIINGKATIITLDFKLDCITFVDEQAVGTVGFIFEGMISVQ